ncbi:MAG: MetQ/NlpA family ABC transporter substrate-binding protein [Agathobaculum sp.]|uniref:MetQ/NlpA family ABC transporter substrate-binding protein n=1 Tax=Agathobaculum sp. TaxID=2048138 RepID=UPI0025BDE77B|nr:MetQ/NlpA family ABC transporter substrate-binding protein [Agathobaculum sp.]MCI7125117.1 MetQ/NlpA family ABC transporter substrate-binding protein [Agathobaculum sp.]MDY3712031.1 MetQ/NlpA family ABC transporter substrate-binding protein [Agathobaculum sp.]
MKKKVALVLAGTLLTATLAGCGGGNAGGDKLEVIKVGATPTPHAEILNAAKDILAEKGYDLQITEFTDYIQPNVAVNDGQLDANYFQHLPYLEQKCAEEGYALVNAGGIHYEPYGLYPGKTATIDALPDGATIAVPNDATNETRALLLLQDQGLIKLKDGIDATQMATVLDIVENPKNLNISELAAEQIPRSLQDVDMAVINGNYALQFDLNVNDDAVAAESAEYGSVYVNVIACRAGDENSDKIKALVEALHSDTVKQFIEEKYQGAVVPTF